MSFQAWLSADEFVIPTLMIAFGGGSLFFEGLIRQRLQKSDNQNSAKYSSQLHDIGGRFEHRKKVSWILTFVGALWLSAGLVVDVLAR